MRDLWWTKWHWDRFFSELSVFPCRFHSTGAALIVKVGKKTAHQSIIIIGVAQKGLRLCCEGPFRDFLTLEHGTDTLSRKVGKVLPLDSA
jgi:hypothetical protein